MVCAALLFEGANLLVDNGILLAQALHVPERVIAVTFIALGTSLPELVTAINALIKGYGGCIPGQHHRRQPAEPAAGHRHSCRHPRHPVTPQVASVDIPLGIRGDAAAGRADPGEKRGYRWQKALLLVIYGAYCVIPSI